MQLPPGKTLYTHPIKSIVRYSRTPWEYASQISILDLLHTSPIYKEILDKALQESRVPIDINATNFKNLVGHLDASSVVSFRNSDIPAIESDHILPLHIIFMVSNFVVKHVMIDNGSTLNLCTLKLIK